MHNGPGEASDGARRRGGAGLGACDSGRASTVQSQRRDAYEQHEQWFAMPSEKVEQVGGQEYRRGKGQRQIPDSP